MYKILLVEDDEGIAKEIADYAAGWGLEVHIAKNFENIEYYGAAEPPVRCGESHLSGLTEPLRSL